ncbi:c-di-GMP-binding flagellar brake protein YcgR, contains PilZNR and PilZ domains [Rhodoferax sp. OV413]|uniref:flagellar brake protein n=1 Tax=Rhodoferax sp. OV413 TaxID=1855285 RepID=UPI0008866332|nr:flagellar brake protein [Rhodoferax sp. OV413]SDN94902.1 c-di-GMP-binding flagellar brake protein YcgR, contains PilZNR and PilZ domains [Rhodoferax sp. OV413]
MTKKSNIEFEDMNLQVGVRLQIMPSKAANPSVHYTSLIGFVSGEYLLLKIPQEGAVLHEGDSVIIRVFSGVSVYTFSSQVESVLKSPHAMMVLAFPAAIQKVGLRKAVRVKANLPVKIKNPQDPANFKMATLSDISLSGALVSTARPLGTAGDTVDIEFSLRDQASNQEVTIATTASIRSVQQSAGSTADGATFQTVYSHGINFHDLGTREQAILQNFVYETLLIHRT